VRELLTKLFVEEEIATDNVCVAGSAPLQWLLLSFPLDRIPKAFLTRSKDPYDIVPKGCLFQPNDVDIFIYGDVAKTQQTFEEAVNGLIYILHDKGYDVVDRNCWETLYILKNIPVLLISVYVRNVYTTLQFVQCPTATSNDDILSRFDMDIVKVAYDIDSGTIIVDDEVKRSILRGEATVRNFEFGLSGPTIGEIHVLKRTLLRMEKYAWRGFHFTNKPKLLCSMTNVMQTPLAGMLPMYKPIEEPEMINEAIADVVAFMEAIIPMSDLKSGKVGLFGELLLMKVLSDNESTLHRRILGAWKVHRANICVCGDDAKLRSSFENRIRRLYMDTSKSRDYTVDKSYKVSDIVDGLGTYTRYTMLGMKEVNVLLRFVQCKYCETCRDVANRSKIGIERIWYDFNTHKLEVYPGIMDGIRTALIDVDDLVIKEDAPTSKEAMEICSVLERMQYYHAQGFLFEKYPRILSYEDM